MAPARVVVKQNTVLEAVGIRPKLGGRVIAHASSGVTDINFFYIGA